MRVTISHDKTVQEVRSSIDQGFDQIFQGLPVGAVKISDQQRSWSGDTLNFSCSVGAGFMNIPIKGAAQVEAKQVVIDIDLPGFVTQFIPEAKIQTAVETQVRGLLQ